MKKLKFILGSIVVASSLSACSSAYFASASYASDDLYAVHDRTQIALRKQAEAEAQRAEAEARKAQWEAMLAEAEAAAADLKKGDTEMRNRVRALYERVSFEELCGEIGALLTPPDLAASVEVVFQRLEDVHAACPMHRGDWYFSGDYPTPGGNRVVNRALVNYAAKISGRSY